MNIYGDNISMQSWILCLLTLTALTSGQTITSPPDSATGVVGDDVSFSCKVEFGPIKAMAWEFNKIIIYSLQDTQEHYPSGMDKYSVTNDEGIFTLRISKVDFTDGGIYTCTTMIPTASATLIVLGKPELSTSTGSPVEGSTVVYTCTAEFAGPPEEDILSEHYPSLQMLLDGVPQDAATKKENCERSTNCYKLTQIHNIKLKADMNGKIIICDIQTSKPQVHENRSTNVTVLYSVKNIAYTPEQKQHEVGSTLSCSADGNPEPQYVWDDKNSENSVDGQTLLITELMLGSNIWTCTAKNIMGEIPYERKVVAAFSAVLPKDSQGSAPWKIGIGVTFALLVLVIAIVVFLYNKTHFLPCKKAGQAGVGSDVGQNTNPQEPQATDSFLPDDQRMKQNVSISTDPESDNFKLDQNTIATHVSDESLQPLIPTSRLDNTSAGGDEHVNTKASMPKGCKWNDDQNPIARNATDDSQNGEPQNTRSIDGEVRKYNHDKACEDFSNRFADSNHSSQDPIDADNKSSKGNTVLPVNSRDSSAEFENPQSKTTNIYQDTATPSPFDVKDYLPNSQSLQDGAATKSKGPGTNDAKGKFLTTQSARGNRPIVSKESIANVKNTNVTKRGMETVKAKNNRAVSQPSLDRNREMGQQKQGNVRMNKWDMEYGRKEIVHEEMFHGKLPREWGECLLEREGDYLITEGQAGSGQFELMIKTKKIQYLSLTYTQGTWTLINKHFSKKISELTSRLPRLLNVPSVRPIPHENWELNTHNVFLDNSQITNGTFGKILKGKHDGRIVAVKICRESETECQRKAFLNDGHYLRMYSHRNIIRFIGITVTDNPLMMVLEKGDLLKEYLQIYPNEVKILELIKMCKDVSEGMGYLKGKCCIHRDLAAQNCLADEHKSIKICNFHMAREGPVHQADQSDKDLLKWPAPEASRLGTYNFSSDVWSFGVLMWEIFFYGLEPYKEISQKDVQSIRAGNILLPAPKDTPHDMYKLIMDCWKEHPEARPSLEDLQCRIKDAYHDDGNDKVILIKMPSIKV